MARVTVMPGGGRAGRFVRVAALAAAGTAFGVLLAEVMLRLAGFGDPSLGRPDSLTGWSGRPGATGWQRAEGEVFVRNNSAGFHDREHTIEKPPGVYRIAVLGDSFTEAAQVPIESAFWSVAEKDLATCSTPGPRRFEVLNFGVGGFGTAQELLMLTHRAAAYHPDLVLLAFFTGNDVMDNSRALSEDPLKPYFVLRDGVLVSDESFRTSRAYMLRSLGYSLLRWSRIFQIVKRWERSRESREARRGGGEHVWTEGRSEVYRQPSDPRWNEAWAVTEALVVKMRDEARSLGAQFAVVTLSNSLQVYPVPDVRANHLRDLGIDNPFYPDERIARLGERQGFPVMNLAPLMLDIAQTRQVSLHGFPNAFPNAGHWNEEGHHIAGTILAPWICRLASGRTSTEPTFADGAAPAARR